jgi:cation diffusion facilitator CzcD-associated flavoprotein CzcO
MEAHDMKIPERHDLCIVGAGLAGLNALAVASEYLGPGGSILLVDRRDRPGGMWVDTYNFVRLHQPHPLFTAGNIPWTLGKDRNHLATKHEVLDHLQHCLEVAASRVQVTNLFGWEVESHDEAEQSVRITCRSANGGTRIIEAGRLIRAFGHAVSPKEPLQLSSARVRSVSPDHRDMRSPEIAASNTPVWVIGGGKTAMDTAYTLVTTYPGREVNLVAGPGTFFMKREEVFPAGAKRWWGGKLMSSLAVGAVRRYDGTDAAQVNAWIQNTCGTSLVPEPQNFMFGVLSEAETRTIEAGLSRVVTDYLEDVVDQNEQPQLVLRGGDAIAIEPDSWIVNCTGYLLQETRTDEPAVSAGGNVISIHTNAATGAVPSGVAYFLTHLLYRGELDDAPLYELDLGALRRRAPADYASALAALDLHNLSVILERVPSKVMMNFGADLDGWYPLPRQMLSATRFMVTHRRHRERSRRCLDRLRERHDIAGGVREQPALEDAR